MILHILFLLFIIQTPLIAKISLQYQSQLSEKQQEQIAQFYKGKPILVTGGCGFIGSHLAEELVKLEAKVTIIDDLSTGSTENIAPFKNKVKFIQESITSQNACDKAVKNQEIIFHLAACISVPRSLKNPTACHDVNVTGTFHLLEAARIYGAKRFILSSTAAVYGPREDECKEIDTHLKPLNPYGVSKRIDEIYCEQYSLLFNVPCVVLRYFNVYGPRQNPLSEYAAVVAKFNHQLANNKPITIFGDGTQTRDFVHVKQIVEANLLVAMAPESLVLNQIYNIGTNKPISIHALAKDLQSNYPSYSQTIQFLPSREGDVQQATANCSKFSSLMSQILNQ